MNRLKHILGVNVPRHVPSTTRSRGTGVSRSGQFRQGSTRLVSKGSRTICKQRSKTKSSVMSLKKSSLESVTRGARHSSTYQNVKFNGDNGSSKRRVFQKTMNDTNNTNRNSSFIASVEKQPRSYMEMIADYSEAIRKASAAAARNDNSYFGNAVRKSPFSTFTSPPLSKKMINFAKESGASSKRRANGSLFSRPLNPFDRSIRCDNMDIAEHRDLQNHETKIKNHQVRVSTTTELKSEDRSYIKPVADCSKSAHNVSVASNGALAPKLNALARSSLESFVTPTRNASSTNNSQGIPRKASHAVVETSSLSARQSSTRVSTSTSASKQPQVELHMVPSAKESVVSINVDSASARLSSPMSLVSEELSVVVRSNQKTRAPQSNEVQWNTTTTRQGANSALRRGDFGPMRISISEDSAPIKQIEFSINGKPVSELRSIVARTERLDVVTSSDKIEIRVPFAKEDAASRSRAEDELRKRSEPSLGEILNVQISANFQSQPTKGGTERNAATIGTAPMTPSPQAPASRSSLKEPGKASSATSNDTRQHRASARTDVKPGDTVKRKTNERKISSESRGSNIQREKAKKLSADKSTMDVSSIERAKHAETGRLCAKRMTNPRYPEANRYDKKEPSDIRVPSDMIPWWSSSDGFNRMKKKEDNRKSQTSDWNEETLPNALTDNADATTNNSSDIPYWNSSEQREEFNPTVHYPLFGLKPNRENLDSTSEVMKNDLNINNTQTPVTEEDSEEISNIGRAKPVTLSTPETTNVQSKHNANGESDTYVKKASVLPEKLKKSKDTAESNYSLKETNSNDDAFGTNTKVKNILNVIKPIEKKKDGTLIDYGLKMASRKATMKLNSDAKEIRNPPPAIVETQDLTSKKSMIEMASKPGQINKTAAIKRIKSDKAKKSEMERIILKGKNDPIVKDLATSTNIKASDENHAENIKEEFQQNRPKRFSCFDAVNTTETQKSEKLNSLKPPESKDIRHLSKEFTNKQMIQRKKSPLVTADTIKSFSQKKPNLSSIKENTKNHNPPKDSIDKNLRMTRFVHRPADKLAKATDVGSTAVESAKRSSASGDFSSKNRQENQLRKSKSAQNKRNPAESADPPKKPSGSTGCKSADSKTRMRTEVKFSESHANFNRNQPSAIGSVAPWAHVDRPEKSALYSAWLQRLKSDVDDHKELF